MLRSHHSLTKTWIQLKPAEGHEVIQCKGGLARCLMEVLMTPVIFNPTAHPDYPRVLSLPECQEGGKRASNSQADVNRMRYLTFPDIER